MDTTVASKSSGRIARPRALIRLAVALLLLTLGPWGPHPAHGSADAGGRDRPLAFEANGGQVAEQVKFLARAAGYTVFLTPGEAVLTLRGPGRARSDVRMHLVGGNPSPSITAAGELRARVRYVRPSALGPSLIEAPTYARVQYAGVYPGVDLVYYGAAGQLEYDFVVAAGADPGVIAVAFAGVDRLELDAAGDLVLHTAAGALRQPRPVIYQEIDGARRPVAGAYAMTASGHVGFHVGAYDRARPLVIDPLLLYGSYLGGSGDELDPLYGSPTAIAVDAAGNIYVTGLTTSVDFPTTPGADRALDGDTDAFVTKLSPTGAVIYSTYLGGPCDDQGRGIAVDAAGNAYITGRADSGFCFADVRPGALVAKLNPAGALVYFRTFGGEWADTSMGQAIAHDGLGHAYVTGLTDSPDFPTTPGAYRRVYCGGFLSDGFVAKVHAASGDLVYSTYLCGDAHESPNDIAIDAAGNAYVTGSTHSLDFPVVNALQDHHRGGAAGVTGFVAKLNAAGSDLIYSTYLGGSFGDLAQGIAVDAAGHAYVTGVTQSSDFPTTPGVLQPAPGPWFCLGELCTDAFVTKLGPTGSTLVYSTYLFGEAHDAGARIAVDAAGHAYVVGETSSIYFPILDAFQPVNRGLSDAFVVKLSPDATRLVYSTYLGGGQRPESSFYTEGSDGGVDIALDPAGNAYVTGYTSSLNFPTTPGAYQPNPGGGDCFLGEPCGDAFVAKIAASGPGVIPPTRISATPAEVPPGGTVTATWAGMPAPNQDDEIRLYPLGGDEAVGFWPTGGAAGGTLALALPDALPFGTYELRLVHTDPATLLWSVVARSHPIRVGAVAPAVADLIVVSLGNPPASAAPGASFSASDTVRNQGAASAALSRARYYLSLDGVKDAGDTLLAGMRSVPALAPGAEAGGAVSVTIPATIASGSYRLLACADDTGLVGEGNEANNCQAAAGMIAVGRPDLVETAIANPPTAAKPGASFAVAHTVRNQGAAAATASMTRYHLSTDLVRGPGDVLLTGVHAVPALAPGATSSKTVTVGIPAGTAPGTYAVLACADDGHAVTEDSETNNCRASAGTITVALPDLVQQSVSNAGGPFRPGARFTVSDTAFNDSPMATGKSATTKYYFSVDGTRGPGDKLLGGTRTVANLAPFTGSSKAVMVTIPSTTAQGTYVLIACADDTGSVAEANETNNCRASATAVLVAP